MATGFTKSTGGPREVMTLARGRRCACPRCTLQDGATHLYRPLQTGTTHAVDVEAETLYEAAGLGLATEEKDGWIEGLGPGSRLEIQVREPATVHTISVQQLYRWLDSVTASPADVLRRARVKQMLGR